MLSDHPDKQFASYIINGIEHGFRIGCKISQESSLQPAKHNMLSASKHHEIIDKYLKDECEKGRVAGPFDSEQVQGVHISQFGVIPKNLSQGSGN